MSIAATQTSVPVEAGGVASLDRSRSWSDPEYQAFWLLRVGFVVAPIAFGLDKFAHVLVNWDLYLASKFINAQH